MTVNKVQTVHGPKPQTDFKRNKKQVRMMKNRESASNSRKRKKEYMTRLESKVSNLASDNYSLKDENEKLKALILRLNNRGAETCK